MMQVTVQPATKRPPWRINFQNAARQWQARDELNEVSARALAQDLVPVRFRGELKPGEVAVICVLRNEAARLPLFFEHYKKLGVDRFIMVDNDSSDGSAEVLNAEPLADIFLARSSFEASYFGIYWYNGIAQAWCRGHWILVADADELLVYDGMERHDIKAFAERLERRGSDRAFVPMIDLYTSGVIGKRQRSVAEIVAEDSWFDSKGYKLERYPAGWILAGGPRERLFNTAERTQPHWVSKYPFFWVGEDTVIFDNHFIWPWDREYRGPEAAFLHLKILDDFIERCAVNERENQHANNSTAYRIINRRISELTELVATNARSRRYRGPHSLIRNRLLLPLDWQGRKVRRHRAIVRKADSLDDKPTTWLKSLPPSGLVWPALQDYKEISRRAVSEQLETIRCRGPLAPGEVGAICILRNEASRLPLFIDHYKRLGVDRFFMVDNQSEDGTRELLLAEPSADVFVAHASFAAGSGGLYWANGLAEAYCTGNWVVRPDADELMVYDGMEARSLRDLGGWLWNQGQDRIFAMMLDVYPSGNIGSDHLPIADMLREDCWYDSEGYSLEANYGGWLITGGPRHRVFNRGQAVAYSHWISKYPFFRMGRDTAIVSHHWIWPMDWRANAPQAALLHLKLMDDFIERSARYEREGQHAFGSRAYQLINQRLAEMPEISFFHANSRRYRGPQSLLRYRVMRPIDWGK